MVILYNNLNRRKGHSRCDPSWMCFLAFVIVYANDLRQQSLTHSQLTLVQYD